MILVTMVLKSIVNVAIIRFQGAVFSQPNTIHCTYVHQCRDGVAKLLHESLQLYSDIICA